MPSPDPRAEKSATWTRYYERLRDRPSRGTVLFALDRFCAEGRGGAGSLAVDLGCGAGRDVIEMLRRGWAVFGIDAEAAAIEALRQRPDLPAGARLRTRIARFEDTSWPEADLVNSSFALPLCPPARFGPLWQRILGSLKPGGRLSAQLLGPNDDWHGDATITFHRRSEIEDLLAPLKVEMLREEEVDSRSQSGRAKHWHLYHIVARRPDGQPGHSNQT